MTAILTIGTATDRVDFLDSQIGIWLDEWRHTYAPDKDTWSISPVSEGRRLMLSIPDNAIETMVLKVLGSGQDEAIYTLRHLQKILKLAEQYWTTRYQPNVVYIEAKASCESNTRYAVVHKGIIPELEDTFGQPFFSPYGMAVLDNVTVSIERGPWLDAAPGTGTCVAVTGTGSYQTSTTLWTGSPTQSTDDVRATSDDASSLVTNGASINFGSDVALTTHYDGAIRFPSVAVPQGATILTASVQFRATGDRSNSKVNLIIKGEDVNNANTFSDIFDYKDRVNNSMTSASVPWQPDTWTNGNDYVSPDLTSIIQEVVNRAGFEQNNSIALFFLDNDSDDNADRLWAAWDHATAPAPILTIEYASTSETTYGRSSTCNNEVYIGNKRIDPNITDIYSYDTSAGSWTANQAASTAFNLLPALPIQTGDFTVFGINTDLANSGPFDSLVFDVAIATLYTGTAQVGWEYYDGGGWTALAPPNIVDNTDNTFVGLRPFTETGVNSVHWTQPDDWTIGNLNTIFGGAAPDVDGYWIRAYATVAAGAITPVPTQQNRTIYTVSWPEVSFSAIGGDFLALGRIRLEGQSTTKSDPQIPPGQARGALRVVLGMRKTSRGANFVSHLNCADEQNPAGITLLYEDDLLTFTTDSESPTGIVANYDQQSAESIALRFILPSTLSPDFYGVFRAFIRSRRNLAAAETHYLRLRAISGYGGIVSQSKLVTVGAGEFYLADMGRITLGAADELTSSENTDSLIIDIMSYSSTGGGTIDLVDLILIPADEWIGEYEANLPVGWDFDGFAGLGTTRILDIDGIVNSKHSNRALLRVSSTDDITAVWAIRGGPPRLHEDDNAKLYMVTDYDSVSYTAFAATIQMYSQRRYESLRGDS